MLISNPSINNNKNRRRTMKTKILSPLRRDGYKAGMIMMLIALSTMLLTTACSSEDDALNNTANTENTINKGYALPVTVNVTRGDGATRASYNESTRKLNFSAGDKLFVEGIHTEAARFAGTLDYDTEKGNFSGTIYTQNSYSGTADALLTDASASGKVNATLLPNGYESYNFLSIYNYGSDDLYDDVVAYSMQKAFVASGTAKKTGVEQLSWEKASTYSSGFALAPQNAILNFTITGFAASTQVAVVFTSNDGTVNEYVTTDGSGNATFALGVSGGEDLHNCTLSVAGNAITLVNSSKTLTAGKIYNITRAVTPPTLAQTMTTAGMTVKVKYNYNYEENYCLFSSNGDGTYTFQSGDGFAGSDNDMAKALVVEDGKLVFKQNVYETIDDLWSNFGFSATFDTSNNSYKQFVGPSVQEYHNPSFISVEVNSVPIALTQIITVSDLVKANDQSWSTIIANNSDKIKAEDDYYVVRISDNAKLKRNMFGDVWQDVTTNDKYQSMDTYKFEGD